VLIDFEDIHRTYLVGSYVDGIWQFTPTHATDPRKGMIVSSHTVFSNNALQASIFLYNRVNEKGQCVGVNHCLLLCFSHKVNGSFQLNNDNRRITFNLDLGVTSELYALAIGHAGLCSYRAVRAGRAPKLLEGVETFRDGRRVVLLRSSGVVEGRNVSIEVELSKADLIALAAHCVGYGRLLYPSLSDSAVQELLSPMNSNIRACAENSRPMASCSNGALIHQDERVIPEPHRVGRVPSGNPRKLSNVIWAIGNQKWPRMQLKALKRIQQLEDATLLQELIDEANGNNFTRWDAYLD